MKEVDLDYAVVFYDDRNKGDIDFKLVEVLYSDQQYCYGMVAPIVRPRSYLAQEIEKSKSTSNTAANDNYDQWWKRVKREHVLFDIATGEVLTKNLDSWYATNDVSINGRYEDNAHEMPELNG